MKYHHPEIHSPTTMDPCDGGFSLLEVLLATVLMAVALSAIAGSFTGSVHATSKSRELSQATRFVREVMASVDQQPYSDLLALNGDVYYDPPNQTIARFSVDLSVAVADIGLLELSAVLRDHRTGTELSRVVTHRSAR